MIIFHKSCVSGPGPGCCYYLQKPCRRTISFRNYGKSYIFPLKEKLFISFPSMIFKIDYIEDQGQFVEFGSNLAFGDNLESLYIPPLPNIYWAPIYYHKICPGVRKAKRDQTLEDLCEEIISDFWQSQFNFSFWQTEDFMPRQDEKWDFFDWERKTKADPLWVPDLKFFYPVPTFVQRFTDLSVSDF